MDDRKDAPYQDDITKRLAGLSPEKRMLLEKRLWKKNASDPSIVNEPIAIIGLSCRLPGGANTPEDFWKLLYEGRDAVSEISEERWRLSILNKSCLGLNEQSLLRWGGFLDSIDKFDPAFFDISPREAATMDPQQRIAMEVAWEALESAGQPLQALTSSDTGIFLGLHSQSSDYYWLQLNVPAEVDMHAATGGAHSIAANRLSYFLDLRGPSMAIDTACSSSLVAVHLACQSLRSHECSMALAGGVNLILSPENSYAFSKLQFLSPDGRCKTFDAGANGYVRGEGCGIIVLRRLQDAIDAGDPIMAIIRGSAVNQDGATNGLTAPNGLSQQTVVQRALKNAGVEPGRVTFVETHGTGTALGDPIEVEALIAVMDGKTIDDQKCYLGAVKSNIGHLEAAAGIAGIIKIVLCMQNRSIPANLHFLKLNPHISLQETKFRIPTETQKWIAKDGERFAGVSSFGFGGTNSHVVLQEAPKLLEADYSGNGMEEDASEGFLLTLSARSEEALSALVGNWQGYLAKSNAYSESLRNICYTASVRRTHHVRRFAVAGCGREELIDRLNAFYQSRVTVNSRQSAQEDLSRLKGPAFVFSGQGPQWFGMGRQLLEQEPVYREMIERCDNLLQTYADWSLLEELKAEESASRMNQTEIAQPAIFALQMGLAALWRSWGIEPEAVVGHSVGEVAAACFSGILNLEDAIRVVYYRGRLLQRATGQGCMAAADISLEKAERYIADYRGRLTVAAINSPTSVTLSGESEAMSHMLGLLKKQNIYCRMLPVNYAFHSKQIEPFSQEMIQSTAGIETMPASITVISTVTGKLAENTEFGPEYWAENIRRPVRFAEAIDGLILKGNTDFVEIGPHPVLSLSILQCLSYRNSEGKVFPSLRRGKNDKITMLESLGGLYTLGCEVNWKSLYPLGGRCVQLPSYPWQKKRYWIPRAEATVSRPPYLLKADSPSKKGSHLLGRRLDSPLNTFESRFSTDSMADLNSHLILGMPIFPMTAYLEMALAAAAEVLKIDALELELIDLTFNEPLVFSGNEDKTVQAILKPNGHTKISFEIYSRPAIMTDDKPHDWQHHVSGTVRYTNSGLDRIRDCAKSVPLEEIQKRCNEQIAGEVYYELLRARGLESCSVRESITRIWRRDGEALAEVRLPVSVEVQSTESGILPSFLSSCIQMFEAVLPQQVQPVWSKGVYLPVRLESLSIGGFNGSHILCHVTARPHQGISAEVLGMDLCLYDESRESIGAIQGLHFKYVDRKQLTGAHQDRLAERFYNMAWIAKQHSGVGETTFQPDFIPSPSEIAEAVLPEMDRLNSQDELMRYKELSPQLDALCFSYVLKALDQLGWKPSVNQPVTVESLVEQLGIVSHQHRLLSRLMEMLQEEGVLQFIDNRLFAGRLPEMKDLQQQWEDLHAAFPAFDGELALLRRCGGRLGDILCGKVDAIRLLFPEGSLTSVEKLYQGSPIFKTWNRLVQATISQAIRHFPEGRKLRILEVGAGTGATTANVVQGLAPDQMEYTFTDVSNLFLSKAKTKFREYPYFRYHLLDIEKNPEQQGFPSHQFDVILAANVLHATADLQLTLSHVKKLLVPKGLLILLEVTAHVRWIDLIFGLTEGWWKFSDLSLRPSYPLLSRRDWLKLLEQQGFNGCDTIPQVKIQYQGDFPHAIILARGPEVELQSESVQCIAAQAGQPRNWLVFADRSGVGRLLAERIHAQGQACVQVLPNESYHAPSENTAHINPENRADFERLLHDICADGRAPLAGIVHLWGLDAGEFDQTTMVGDQVRVCGGLLHLVQALIKADIDSGVHLWLVTRGVQPLGETWESLSLGQSPLWGLGRAIDLEKPDLWGGIVDLDPADQPEVAAERVLTEIWCPDGEDQIGFRGPQRFVARLERSPIRQRGAKPFTWQSEGAYLITGGLGRLGLKVARWMADQGARHLVLSGRKGLQVPSGKWPNFSDGSASQTVNSIRAIERLGTSVNVIAADVSDWKQISALVEQFGKTLPPLRGVIHAAAMMEMISLNDLDLKALESTFKPKVLGAWALHQLTREMDLDFFVLFSSGAALWGAKNQAHYAAANQFLDTLAHQRRRNGLPALTINWGWWAGGGTTKSAESYFEKIGLNPMSDLECLESLGDLLNSDEVQKAVSNFDWRIFGPILETKKRRPFLEKMLIHPQMATQRLPVKDRGFRRQLEEVPVSRRRDLLLNHVRALTAQVLGFDVPDMLDSNQGFFSMGMDSIMTLQLKTRIEESLWLTLPQTTAFEHPNIEALTNFLADEVLSLKLPVQVSIEPPSNDPDSKDQTEVEALSEADMVELLAERLKGLGKDKL